MKHLKTGVTTLFLMVLCYGITVPDYGVVVKSTKTTVSDTTKIVKKVK